MAPASASQFTNLYSFCSQCSGSTGYGPQTNPIIDASGNFFGATGFGGAQGAGAIYELQVSNGKYKYHELHALCSEENCADGTFSTGRLIADINGNLYGTLRNGGANGSGVLFKLTHVKKNRWKYAALYQFCAQSGCSDGASPRGGLTYAGADKGAPYDGISPLFGATDSGGNNDSGTVYALSFPQGSKKPLLTVLYTFCLAEGCPDGMTPTGGLTIDADGNLFGLTQQGGGTGMGVVYELKPQNGAYSESVIHSFCVQDNCADGRAPTDALARDGSGNLYGTTSAGGVNDFGTLFKLTPKGKAWKQTVLHMFCSQSNCVDGYQPEGEISVAPNGDIFGTTYNGGGDLTQGVLYKVHGQTLSVLQSFCFEGTGCDGYYPMAGAFLDNAGNVYGTTYVSQGPKDGGTLFKYMP